MPSERERWVGHLDLYLHTKNRPTEALDLGSAFDMLIAAKIAGSSQAAVSDPRWIVQLADLKINPRDHSATALFLGIDRERASAVYGDLRTLDLRTAAKLENEGGAVSAHLVVSTQPDPGSGRYRTVLEEVEGLSRSRLIPILNKLMQDHVQFTDTLPNGQQVNVDSRLTTDVYLDKPIGQQLDEARLLAVELVRKVGSGVIDSHHEYFEKARLIQFRPTSESRGAAARRIIRHILESPEISDYPEVRIRLEEDSGPQRSVSVNRSKQDALTSAFQLRTLIDGLDPPLEEATKVVVPHLISAMVKALRGR